MGFIACADRTDFNRKAGSKVCWGFAYCTDQSVRTQKRSISVTLCIGERERERGPVPGMPTPLNIQNRQQRSLHEMPMMGQEMDVTTAAIVVGACSLMCKTEGPVLLCRSHHLFLSFSTWVSPAF